MPELPEVETTLRGLKPYVEGQVVTGLTLRAAKLRTPLEANLPQRLIGRTLSHWRRRNKFILADSDDGHTLLIHLGMTGRFFTVPTELSIHPTLQAHTPLALHPQPPLQKHDHVILTTPLAELRFNDARRFGLFEYLPSANLPTHPFLKNLGPEPLEDSFTGAVLHQAFQRTRQPVKVALMDNKNVVGVGNIYASESLFRARLNPTQPASSLTLKQCNVLVGHIKQTLTDALLAGGSSLRDFQHADGALGYFQHSFNVYGRATQACHLCTTPVLSAVMAQRNTFWCPTCQPLPETRRTLKH